MRTGLALVPLAIALICFEVYCLVQLRRVPAKVLPVWAWVVVILASIPVGGITYLCLGRGENEESEDGLGASGASGTDRLASHAPVPGPERDTQPTDAVIETVDLRKTYGQTRALDGIALSVPAGSVFGLVGPNGAGKTTLLAMLAGLRHPDTGTYSFGASDRRVAYLPDTPTFEPWLTAREVVDLARVLTAPEAKAARTDEVLVICGLAAAADRRNGGFSRGMLQRLGLAATIVGDPEVLLLDEPCSALDPMGRREVLDLVGRLGGRHTVLFCSHILDDVQEVCDRVGILRAGRLIYQGPLAELLTGHAAPKYRIRVHGPARPIATALAAEPWVTGVSRVLAEELDVTAISVAEAESGLAPALSTAGARLVSVVPVGADLENVFLELTG